MSVTAHGIYDRAQVGYHNDMLSRNNVVIAKKKKLHKNEKCLSIVIMNYTW
jgi:hypothetical protein